MDEGYLDEVVLEIDEDALTLGKKFQELHESELNISQSGGVILTGRWGRLFIKPECRVVLKTVDKEEYSISDGSIESIEELFHSLNLFS